MSGAHINVPDHVEITAEQRARAGAYVRRHCPDLLAMLGLDDAPSAPVTGSRRADDAARVRDRAQRTSP